MNYLKKIILLINIVLVVALLLSYLSPTTDPNESWIWSFFGIFYPIILLCNLSIMIVWILIDYKYLFLSLITIFFGTQHLTSFININGRSKESADLHVMSYNIGSGYGIRDKDNERQTAKIKMFKNYLSSIDPLDIICLQESTSIVIDIFKSKHPDHHFLKVKNKGAVMFSKYPIVNSGNVDFGTRTNSCVYADIKLPSGIVRVYNLHLQSNRISKDAAEVLDKPELNEPETWSSIKGILSKYRAASQKRSIQAQKVKIHASTSPHPVIIVGDVNDPPTAFSYQTLSSDMSDAFTVRGSGIGTTYGGSIPMLRIDYILTDPTIEVLDYQCKEEKFSDHYPIFAKLKI